MTRHRTKTSSYLILIQVTIFEFFFVIITLKGDNDKTNEDVHHEEGDDDDVDHEVESHMNSIVSDWSMVDSCRVDSILKNSK